MKEDRKKGGVNLEIGGKWVSHKPIKINKALENASYNEAFLQKTAN